MVALVGASTTVMIVADVIAIASDAALSGAAAGVAVTVTRLETGRRPAQCRLPSAPEPATLRAPQDVPEHPAPETAQEIAGFGFEFGTGVSVAERPALAPAATDEGPLTVKVKLLVMVIAAVAFFEGSATLVAVIVTVGGDGKVCGAVKRPIELMAPHAAPAQPDPLSAHVTRLLGFPAETMPA